MRRTTALLHLSNAVLAPGLWSARDPDAVFEQILARAQRGPGLDGFVLGGDDEAALDGLRALLHAFADTPGLSGIGWRSAQDLIAARITNRIAVRRAHAQHPEIADEPITSPIFVVGLPRTATTLTHQLLAAADGARGPELWEMYNVSVPSGDEAADAAFRELCVKATQRRLDMTLKLSPTWDLIHPVAATGPEEDYFLKDHTPLHLAAAPLAGYEQYLADEYDPVADYQFLKDTLQVLSFGRPHRRWVLKHPGNLWSIASIGRVFGDAKIVWTHRDPATVTGSICSMAESLHLLHLKPRTVDLHEIGDRWLRLLSAGVEDARAQRLHLRPSMVCDLMYHRLMADPHQYVPELFEQLDLPWGSADAERLVTALDRPRDGRRHEYTLGRYGLDDDAVEAAFGDYGRMVAAGNLRR